MTLTFEVLCGLEPELQKLYDEILTQTVDWDCFSRVWEEYEEQAKHLVGCYRKNADGDHCLRTSGAYDKVYVALLGALSFRLPRIIADSILHWFELVPPPITPQD